MTISLRKRKSETPPQDFDIDDEHSSVITSDSYTSKRTGHKKIKCEVDLNGKIRKNEKDMAVKIEMECEMNLSEKQKIALEKRRARHRRAQRRYQERRVEREIQYKHDAAEARELKVEFERKLKDSSLTLSEVQELFKKQKSSASRLRRKLQKYSSKVDELTEQLGEICSDESFVTGSSTSVTSDTSFDNIYETIDPSNVHENAIYQMNAVEDIWGPMLYFDIENAWDVL